MVIIDPTGQRQPAFERALSLAVLGGASLHLYLCLDADCDDGHANREQASAHAQSLLDAAVQQAQQQQVQALSEFEWAREWRTGAVRAAARCGADMVVKDCFDHSDLQRQMRATSDWELLRNCPCPVLLVKNYSDWQQGCMLAAVSMQSVAGGHSQLNTRLIRFAHGFADACQLPLHVVSAGNAPLPLAQALADYCGVEASRVHVRQGPAAEVICAMAEELEAQLIIIGSVGRSGIRGRLLGNTAEKLLDHTHADMLVIC